MKVNISSWAIKNPTPVILLFLIACLLGAVAYLKLPIAGTPRVELPIVMIDVSQPGASTEELETNLARRIEDAISGIPNLQNQSTTISNGNVNVAAEFKLDADVARSTNDVRDAISRVRPELPANITEPLITLLDVSGGAMLSYAVRSSSLDEVELSRRIDEEMKPLLLGVPGVQQIKRIGGAQREFRVEIDPSKLIAAGLSIEDVTRQLQDAEANIPAGETRVETQRAILRVMSASTSAQALASRPLRLSNGNSISVGEIATVLDVASEPSGFSLLNGESAIVMEVYKSRGASEVSMAKGVDAVITNYTTQHKEINFTLFYDAVEATRLNFSGAREALFEGALLTILVVYFFLRDARATFIAAAAIPLSLLPTFALMHINHFQLDIVTMLAIILVIGILVDDAIVEVENIERRIEAGDSPHTAAAIGADSLGLAVLAISLTIVAVFLPVSFISGVVGKYFTAFGLTTSFAVLASLAVARLITPLMCAYGMKAKLHKKSEHANSAMQSAYQKLLSFALARPGTVLFSGGVVMLITLVAFTLLPIGFVPPAKAAAITVPYDLPPSSDLRDNLRAAEQLRAQLKGLHDIKDVFAYDLGSPDRGELKIILKPESEKILSAADLQHEIRSRLAKVMDVRTTLNLNAEGKELNLTFVARDARKFEAAMSVLAEQSENLPGLTDVSWSQGPRLNTVDIRLLPDVAAKLGVNPQSAANALRLATLSDLDSSLARIPIDGKQVSVRIRLAGGREQSIEGLRQMLLPSDQGLVALGAVAQLTPSSAPSSLSRLNRERSITLQANLKGISLGDAVTKIEALPAYKNLPEGVRLAPYGDVQFLQEMFEQFGIAALFGLLAVYAILVLLFADWLQPITVMVALPLALSGAAIALLITGNSLNLPSIIGLLLLFGIVGKNSILLLDFIVEARAEGLSRSDAVARAGHERVRPIIMTTIAMIGGMLPAAFGLGSDDGFRTPMAIAVIGGLISSTLLSLIFVPTIYLLIDDVKEKLRRIWQRFGLWEHAS
jgi:multidrug efflux pump subunit AcrB